MWKYVKVVHLLFECRPSGAEVMLKLAAPLWKSWGCEQSIIAIGPSEGDYADALRKAGYSITHLPFSRNPSHFLNWTRAFRQAVQGFSPDVVVNHNETIHVVLQCLVAGIPKKQYRVIHNCFRFGGLLRGRKALERWISRTLRVEQIAISQAVKETEWNEYRNITTVLDNWFDSETFRPPTSDERSQARAELEISHNTLVLTSVGNGSDVKNYGVIIEALSMIPNDKKILYLQVGREHPEQKDRALSEKLGQSHRVRFCGPQSDVRKYLWATDIFLMPSVFEGFALSAAEAIASGTPSILADIEGLAHFRNLGEKVRFCPNSASNLLENIRFFERSRVQLCSDSAFYASRVVRERFGLHNGADRYYKTWVRAILKN